jgi:YVTN family beta-propeller protein
LPHWRQTRARAFAFAAAGTLCAVGVGWGASQLLSGLKGTPRPDPRSTVKIRVGHVRGLAVGHGAIWVANYHEGTLMRVDPRTNRVRATISVGARPTSVAVTSGGVWVSAVGARKLVEVDPSTGHIVKEVTGAFEDVDAAFGSLWAAEWAKAPADLSRWRGRSVARIDPTTGRVVARIRLDGIVLDVTHAFGEVWATSFDRPWLWRIDPRTNRVTARIDLGRTQSRITAGFGALWTTVARGGLARIDPQGRRPVRTVQVPGGFSDFLAAGAGAIWVASYDEARRGTLVEIDPRSRRVRQAIQVGLGPQGLAVGFGSVWVGDLEDAMLWRLNP